MTTETQRERILDWLLLGLPLTALTALKIGGGMKLATRISELRDDGWEPFIKREPVKVKNANGKYVLQLNCEYIGEFNGEKYDSVKMTLMQWTGKKDKNGKEIYEGDIIRFLNGETTSTENGMECDEFYTDGVVFWEQESAQWDITGRIDVSRDDAFTDISEYEIVGNMYQNPLNP